MILRIRDPERGVSATEYSGVLVLVAAIIVAVFMSGFADRPAQMIGDALDRVAGNSPGDGSGADEDTPGDGENAGTDGGSGGSGGSEEDGDGGSEEDEGGGSEEDEGDDGCGWNLFCHGGNAVDAVGDGASAAWEWTTETAAPQVGGFFTGFGEAIWGDITGIGDIFTTNPIDTITGMWDGIREDPWSLLISPEAREAWSNGDYGEAIGGGLWDIGSWAIPGAGWAAKGGKLGRLGGNGSDGSNNDGGNNDNDNDGNNNNDDENDNNSSSACTTGNSFVPGTEVLMADGGLQAIETIDVGDEVWAFDPATGSEGPREVTDLIPGAGEKTLVDVTVTSSSGATGSLTATEEHPFWDPESAEWVEAGDLERGTRVRASDGSWRQVTAIDTRTADQQVHNLTVRGLHTYHVRVGDTSVLVHNDNRRRCEEEAREAGLRQHEIDTMHRLNEIFPEEQLRPVNAPDADYIGNSGKFDAMGHPAASRNWSRQRDGFLTQIDRHAQKSDYAVVDLTDFDSAHVNDVLQHVDSLDSATQNKIIVIQDNQVLN